ncbi:Crp/Fnr family transcriptional regulator [Sediminispirochaeta smaragdinae]|jgi:CRP-like cAMP-binding protein|uniref:Transcriptional regulator, Crp/Fnr family n=1 Tax=Sediminispirochaeta smaragdinae (strain DSM 11293 / JCM 15392 / SEBR 4228) TaxID=573413 RepID=E1R699_SEDSS|nr:Crp/Fnr family transcriptional regulator [Sediminispirochaeta smaragdinae]ADK80864.1 putative transcriptional regulator, Crp/Fnr family [Sediminispirochaeta smaragdinae DSM 11293]
MSLDLSMFGRFAQTYQPGDIIFCEYEPGDTFYLIQSGRVQIVKIMDDIEKNVDILQPGEIFGEMAILEEAPRSASAVAIDKVVALEFNRANFEILMKGNPQIALKLLKLFTKRIYDQKRRFMILTLDDIQARVADVFIMLSETQPVDDPDVNERIFKTTVDDIAHWAGMSPDKCKQILQHFANQRRIELYEDRIVVKNINDFGRFVQSRRRNQQVE